MTRPRPDVFRFPFAPTVVVGLLLIVVLALAHSLYTRHMVAELVAGAAAVCVVASAATGAASSLLYQIVPEMMIDPMTSAMGERK